jgi:hypothetical protein
VQEDAGADRTGRESGVAGIKGVWAGILTGVLDAGSVRNRKAKPGVAQFCRADAFARGQEGDAVSGFEGEEVVLAMRMLLNEMVSFRGCHRSGMVMVTTIRRAALIQWIGFGGMLIVKLCSVQCGHALALWPCVSSESAAWGH